MRGATLLEELVQLARKQGLTVRRESMTRGAGTGGYCLLKGIPTIFIDDRASADAQIEVLAAVLRRMDWSNVFVHPSVRTAVGLAADDDGRPLAATEASDSDEPDANSGRDNNA